MWVFRRQACMLDHQFCNLATFVLPFYTRNGIANALVVRKVSTSSGAKKKTAHVLIQIVGVFFRWQLEHFHSSMVNPRPFLCASISIEARAHNSLVVIVIAIPRFFRGQLTLRTQDGRVLASSAVC